MCQSPPSAANDARSEFCFWRGNLIHLSATLCTVTNLLAHVLPSGPSFTDSLSRGTCACQSLGPRTGFSASVLSFISQRLRSMSSRAAASIATASVLDKPCTENSDVPWWRRIMSRTRSRGFDAEGDCWSSACRSGGGWARDKNDRRARKPSMLGQKKSRVLPDSAIERRVGAINSWALC